MSGVWELDGAGRLCRQIADGMADGGPGRGECAVELEARVTLRKGVAAGLVYRPLGTLDHCGGDVVVGLDAAEQTVFAATLPHFMECHRRRFPVELGRTYRLRVCIRPPRLEAYVDDLLVPCSAHWPRGTPCHRLSACSWTGVSAPSQT